LDLSKPASAQSIGCATLVANRVSRQRRVH